MSPRKVEATTLLFISECLLITCLFVDALMIQAIVSRASTTKDILLHVVCSNEQNILMNKIFQRTQYTFQHWIAFCIVQSARLVLAPNYEENKTRLIA